MYTHMHTHMHVCMHTQTHTHTHHRHTTHTHIHIHTTHTHTHTLGCLGGSVGRSTALKAGGCGFESRLSSLFSMKIEKRALRFVALFPF